MRRVKRLKSEESGSTIALRFQTQGTHHSGNSNGLVVTRNKRLAAVPSFSTQLLRVFNEPQEESRYSSFIAAVKVPAAFESPCLRKQVPVRLDRQSSALRAPWGLSARRKGRLEREG